MNLVPTTCGEPGAVRCPLASEDAQSLVVQMARPDSPEEVKGGLWSVAGGSGDGGSRWKSVGLWVHWVVLKVAVPSRSAQPHLSPLPSGPRRSWPLAWDEKDRLLRTHTGARGPPRRVS
jgi:hypothetical protein